MFLNETALPQTLPDMLTEAARRHGQRPAIVDGDIVIGYDALAAHSEEVARALMALGVEAGDRVAIWAPNIHEWVLAACGVHAAGAVLVPVNTRMKGNEAADILDRSCARVLFCIGELLGIDYPALLAEVRPATLEQVVVLRRGAGQALLPACMDWSSFLEAAQRTPVQQAQQRRRAVQASSTADLLFTSGTTGRPKGVMSAHGQTLRAYREWARAVRLGEGDRYLIVNPFFHSFGYKAGWVAALIQGATIYPAAVFDANEVLRCIADQHINFLPGPPTLFQALLAHPRLWDFDLSSLRGSVTGAASVPTVLIERMRSELGIHHVTTAYGLTECGGVATINDPEDSADRIAGSCGKALAGTELRIADAAGRDLPAGEAGEVLVRGYHVMQGYFEDEAASREAIDAEGWLHTGDVGVVDAAGYLRITDRLKDMFIVGGFNCYPAEIERMLCEHPGIAQAAVIGMLDERLGEVGCAFVVPRAGAVFDESGLIEWCRQRMTNYKVPRRVFVRDSLPINASGKVVKRQLKAG